MSIKKKLNAGDSLYSMLPLKLTVPILCQEDRSAVRELIRSAADQWGRLALGHVIMMSRIQLQWDLHPDCSKGKTEL